MPAGAAVKRKADECLENEDSAAAAGIDVVAAPEGPLPAGPAPSGDAAIAASGVHLGRRFLGAAAALRAAGPGQLQVISDFDETLTRFVGADGGPVEQCHDIVLKRLASAEAARPGLVKDLQPLLDWTATPEATRMAQCGGCRVKRAQRTVWFNETFLQLAYAHRFWELVDGMVEQSNTLLREGLSETFAWLDAHDVPLLVVSAGIAQIIERLLRRDGAVLPSGTAILANDLHDPAPRVTRATKAAAVQQVPEHVARTAGRRCALVLGDKASDCDVAKGLDGACEVLKVGFLRGTPPPEEIVEFLQHFDVALTGDASMNFVNSLLKEIAS